MIHSPFSQLPCAFLLAAAAFLSPVSAAPVASPHTAAPGPDWAPFSYALDIEPGGVFDRVSLADAPAGRHGRIIVTPDGHFACASRPGQRIRFYGVNLCFDANFPTHAQADALAERLARSGYNAVRLHHYDRELVNQLARPSAGSHDFDPAQLDRIDYLFAALKKRGLHINIDMHSMRGFSAAEIPDLGQRVEMEIKHLVPISEAAFAAWASFAEKLLTHTNPHTGLTWAADPALIGICMLNEDTFFGDITRRSPKLLALYEKAFEDWKAANAIPPAEAADSSSQASDDPAFNRFLLETKIASDARMAAWLRNLGVQALLTGDNHKTTGLQTLVRERLEVVDFHDYWSHPNFKGPQWRTPVIVTHQSNLKGSVYLPRNMTPVRVLGKPFTVTEFNYVWPNAARAEGPLLMSGIAALQDWDGLYNFDYATDEAGAHGPAAAVPGRPGRMFSLATDPIGLLADRAGAFLYLHGGIRPAPEAIALLIDDNPATTTIFDAPRANPRDLPRAFSWLGLRTRIGTLPASAAADPARVNAAGIQAFVAPGSIPGGDLARLGRPVLPLGDDIEKRLAASSLLPAREGERFSAVTGQIDLDRTAGSARLVTDYAECYILPPGQGSRGRHTAAAVPAGDAFAGIYILAVDGRPLAESSRLLVLHLTDSVTAGTRFSDSSRTLLTQFGPGPHLIRRGSADITLRLPASSSAWQAWAVDPAGRRTHSVALATTAEGAVTLRAATVTGSTSVTLAYELACHP